MYGYSVRSTGRVKHLCSRIGSADEVSRGLSHAVAVAEDQASSSDY
jgi:hypothetical protein